MSDIASLCHKQNAQKSVVTQIKNWLNKSAATKNKIFEFSSREEDLIKTFSDYKQVQAQIVLLVSKETKDYEEFEETYYSTLSKLRKKIKTLIDFITFLDSRCLALENISSRVINEQFRYFSYLQSKSIKGKLSCVI